MAWHTESNTRNEIKAATLVLIHGALVLLLGGLVGGKTLHPGLVESFWVACLLLWGHSFRVGLAILCSIIQVSVITESGLYFYLLPAITLAIGSIFITGKIQKDHLSVPVAFGLFWIGLTALVGWFYDVTNSRTAVPDYSLSETVSLIVTVWIMTKLVKRLTLPVHKEIV